MPAIWNSYSKSPPVQAPHDDATRRGYGRSRATPSKAWTSILPSGAATAPSQAARRARRRCACGGPVATLQHQATEHAGGRIRSSCPRVMGSKVPGDGGPASWGGIVVAPKDLVVKAAAGLVSRSGNRRAARWPRGLRRRKQPVGRQQGRAMVMAAAWSCAANGGSTGSGQSARAARPASMRGRRPCAPRWHRP